MRKYRLAPVSAMMTIYHIGYWVHWTFITHVIHESSSQATQIIVLSHFLCSGLRQRKFHCYRSLAFTGCQLRSCPVTISAFACLDTDNQGRYIRKAWSRFEPTSSLMRGNCTTTNSGPNISFYVPFIMEGVVGY